MAERPAIDDLPALVTRQHLAQLGLGRAAVDAVFRALPVVALPGVRRVYVNRDELLAFLEANTWRDDRVRPS